MNEMRDRVALQIGQLVLTNIELSGQVEAAKTYIAVLEKTQSKGKAKALKHLAEQKPKR